MPQLKTYDLFISHAWKYSDDYIKIVNLLKEAPYFYWRNYSVPEHDPKIDPNTPVGFNRLKAELDKQIRPVNCVIIIAGMYVAYRTWIQTEINIAVGYNKPIIAVKPRGAERVPANVIVAKETVGWTTSSIIDAIRRYSL